MKKILILLTILCCLAPAARAQSVQQDRAAIQAERDDILNRLHDLYPDTRREAQSSVGYAVFSNGSLAFAWVSGGYGHGIVHDNRSNQDVYMKMATGGLGLGFGFKDYKTVIIFHNAEAFDHFAEYGLDLSGTADAAFKNKLETGRELGGQTDVLPGARIFQLTDRGVMLQAMVQGSKYWLDNALNGDIAGDVSHSSYDRNE